MDEVSTRNFRAIQQAINTMEGRLQQQEIAIERLKQENLGLEARVQVLIQQHLIFKAMGIGRGPTAR